MPCCIHHIIYEPKQAMLYITCCTTILYTSVGAIIHGRTALMTQLACTEARSNMNIYEHVC